MSGRTKTNAGGNFRRLRVPRDWPFSSTRRVARFPEWPHGCEKSAAKAPLEVGTSNRSVNSSAHGAAWSWGVGAFPPCTSFFRGASSAGSRLSPLSLGPALFGVKSATCLPLAAVRGVDTRGASDRLETRKTEAIPVSSRVLARRWIARNESGSEQSTPLSRKSLEVQREFDSPEQRLNGIHSIISQAGCEPRTRFAACDGPLRLPSASLKPNLDRTSIPAHGLQKPVQPTAPAREWWSRRA